MTIAYATADGTAIAGLDYVATSSTVTIPAGQMLANIELIILDPVIPGGDRVFTVDYSESPSPDHIQQSYLGSSANTLNPDAVDSLNSTLVGVGQTSSCFVTNGTAVRCLGAKTVLGNSGYTLDNPSSTGVAVQGLLGATITKLVSGTENCALFSTGRVQCWGINNNGGTAYSIGNGTAGTAPYSTITLPYTDIVDISASNFGTCVVSATGRVFCWGYNFQGRFGNSGSATTLATTSPTGYAATDTPSPKAVKVALGNAHMCLLLENGNVRCSGANVLGQLGNNTPGVTQSSTLVNTLTPPGIQSLFSGEYATCASLADNTVYCWGSVVNDLIGLSNVPTAAYLPTHAPTLDGSKRL